MNIAYASDNNFVDVMCVSIMSFNDHNSDANIYILDCGIEEYNKQKILELCSGKNTVLFVDAKKVLDGLHYDLNLDRGSIASYARLFIGSVLPNDVTKVLYIDSDTLIRGNLNELYNTELNPHIIAGIRDAFSVMNKRVFGIKKGELFINAGVILIDLEAWRRRNIEDGIYELLNNKKRIFQGDQGVINTIFHGNVKELPLKYDVMTYLYDFSYEEMMLYRKPDNYFGKDEIFDAVNDPCIVHFTTSFRSERPWNTKGRSSHPYYHSWMGYYRQFASCHTVNDSRKSVAGGWFTLFFVGIIHAYIRPIMYVLSADR